MQSRTTNRKSRCTPFGATTLNSRCPAGASGRTAFPTSQVRDNRQEKPNVTQTVALTEELVNAGAHAILCEVGGCELPAYFSASELAISVYRAMEHSRQKVPALR
jgi:hypothetical protein